jgi:hypothetical protein
MGALDYTTVAQLFPSQNEAELFPGERRRPRRQPVGYGRFARAADAIRFAIEELPSGLLPKTCLEVDAKIFDCHGIRRLYESDRYPLARRATSAERTRPVEPPMRVLTTHQNPRR